MAYIGFEGDYVELESEVRDAMLSIGGLVAGETHLELGSGSGHFVTAGLALGADSYGWEINEDRYNSSAEIARITHGDVLTNDLKANDIRGADLITFWFTEPTGTVDLMVKLYKAMSSGARLAMLYQSTRQWRDQEEVYKDRSWTIEDSIWIPTSSTWVDGNLVHLFIR